MILDFKGNDCLIGVNALLTFRKGVDIVIRALPALPGYKLFIVGDGKEKGHLEKIAEDVKCKRPRLFAGYVKMHIDLSNIMTYMLCQVEVKGLGCL